MSVPHATHPTPEELPDLPPELRSHPRYRVIRELGRGGMGVVYRAEQTLMNRAVAIKVLGGSLLGSPGAAERFLREVRSAAQLSHPNIVIAHDAEQVGGAYMLVMEYVEGQSLDQVLRRKGPLPLAPACHFARQAALGLQHAFGRGMVHRDIKPQNLMLTPEGQVKILDFGLAKVVRENSGDKSLTAANAYMGTPDYCAPEQATDARKADTRADVYSLGCTLYALLAGVPPFQEETPILTILAHVDKQPRPLPELRPDVPPELWAVVARMLAKDPAQRYQTPAEVAQALAPFCKKKTAAPPARQTAPPRDAGRPPPAADTRGAPETAAPGGLAFAGLTNEAPRARKTGQRASAPRRRPLWLVGGGAVLALLVLAAGAWLAAGFFLKVNTPTGTILLELNEPDAEVSVDGSRVRVDLPGDKEPLRIDVPEGRHELRITKGGFEGYTKEISLKAGKAQLVKVALVPLPPKEEARAAVPPPPPADTKPPATAGTTPPEPLPAGFVPLFDGKDLSGWVIEGGDRQHWQVQDGEIIARSPEWKQQNWLLTEKDYADFALRLEYSGDAGFSSGVAIRAFPGESKPLEAPGAAGARIPLHPTLKLADADRFPGEPTGTTHFVRDGGSNLLPTAPADVHPGWNLLEVEVRDQALVARVNGKVVADFALTPSRGVPPITVGLNRHKGRIGLQAHTGTVRFRNVAVKELPPAEPTTAPPAEATAPPVAPVTPAAGFVPLFNGKSLAGWFVESGEQRHWMVRDGEIMAKSRGAAFENFLLTEKEYADYVLRLEFTLAEGARSGVAVRAVRGETRSDMGEAAKPLHPLLKLSDPVQFPADPTGTTYWVRDGQMHVVPMTPADQHPGWNQLEMEVRGQTLVARVNGKQVVDLTLLPSAEPAPFAPGLSRPKGHIGLQAHRGYARFRNIVVKELTAGAPPTPARNEPSRPGAASPADNRSAQPGGLGGRHGALRRQLLEEGGGSAASEAAVGDGLFFLVRHQAADGHWSLDRWDHDFRPRLDPGARRTPYDGPGRGTKNDVAGTALALLPLLGAGFAHKPVAGDSRMPGNSYQKVVDAGIQYLLRVQTRQGEFPGGMYAHGLAAIALCEAYGMTADPALKVPAQRALDYIVNAQDPAKGGWRYEPRIDSDTSVTGWQLMALKTGQMAGLKVPAATFEAAEKWLNSCMTADQGGYGYQGPDGAPSTSAIGLLCRMYLGWNPTHPGIVAGVARLQKHPPGSINSLYYDYYATQVMHHVGGEDFAAWNPRMRDLLIAAQDKGTTPGRAALKGSWDPESDAHGKAGGRIMTTSLALLTLEVYYRHVPLFRNDVGTK